MCVLLIMACVMTINVAENVCNVCMCVKSNDVLCVWKVMKS